MPDYTCAECGSTFSLRQEVVDRYPGWTPRSCRSCRNGGTTASPRSTAGSGADNGRPSGRARTAAGGGAARARRRRPSPAFGEPPVEENLPLADVLAKYHEGPHDGVFTDGSAHPNPGEGGWGAVYVVDGEVVDQAYGHEPHTTNNRMELTALIAGYDLVPEGVATTVHTDSRLCVDTITKWAPGWERQGWRRKGGEVQNLDLVKALYQRAKARPEITLLWVPGHGGLRWNEYADSLSTAYRRQQL